jgi:hypothetical protein
MGVDLRASDSPSKETLRKFMILAGRARQNHKFSGILPLSVSERGQEGEEKTKNLFSGKKRLR